MTELADDHNPVDLLLDGARYGDLEDVETALHQYKVSVDAADDQGRTGTTGQSSRKMSGEFIVANSC